jgi:hypothetical protein
MTPDEVKAQIVAQCREHWDRTHRALLIAVLGERLPVEVKHAIQLQTGLKLQQFILQQMRDDLRIEARPGMQIFLVYFRRTRA